MAGRIKKQDLELVRERARIEEIVGERVALKPAGPGALRGLCPFHDERTPSFQVRPHLGLWHCFGCDEGGDVFAFMQKADSLTFTETVEYLAGRYGVELHYEDGGRRSGVQSSTRQRLLEANRTAAAYYASQLETPAAQHGRAILSERGFDREAATKFGVGYAPAGWENLLHHLRSNGFTEDEIKASGLASQGSNGMYDRFRDRLIWPIRDLTGSVIGFGARKLSEDDPGPKYLNTPETAIYHKSQVLYGVDLAKKEITQRRQVVIVEGYTDVMAAHLAGVTTAVATCGTAFGEDHIRVVRRLLGDTGDAATGVLTADGGSRGGQVIFTFDGDSAGQKAAMRAFSEDQKFYAQTFVAVAPGGMDPCELRQSEGDQAVRDLVASRQPLFQFAIRTALRQFDLETAEGRVSALRATAPIVARIRDVALRQVYARELAGWLGMEQTEVTTEVRGRGGSPRDRGSRGSGFGAQQDGARGRGPRTVDGAPRSGRAPGSSRSFGATDGPTGRPPTNPGETGSRRHADADPVVRTERHALEAALQLPQVVPPDFDSLGSDAFTVPGHQAVYDAILAAGGVAASGSGNWIETVLDAAAEPVRPLITSLAVASMPISAPGSGEDREDMTVGYVRGVVAGVLDLSLTRQISILRGKMQRLDPVQQAAEQNGLLAQIQELETRKRALRGV